MKLNTSAIVFCDIVDNYGDAGFCLRLSKALLEYIKTVAIFTNKPSIFYKVIGENNLMLINSRNEIFSIFHNRCTSFKIPYSESYIIFDLFETKASLEFLIFFS
ncbi:MAG: elongation factor P maturation arginine rhamnosyltransferase EarP, partial [Burkholderiaceae bacterium]